MSSFKASHRPDLARTLLAVMVALGLVACGGSGSSGANNTPPPPPPPPTTFSVSGTAHVADGVLVDADSNDPNATAAPNNTAAEAQLLPNPATLAGYVTAAATGKTGDRFQTTADALDGYKVTLSAGQVILLEIGEHPAADIDLYLLDSAGSAVIQKSAGFTATESISVTAAGTYIVVVQAATGASNYTLTIGLAPASAASMTGLSLTDEFVPGDVIVRFKDQALPASGTDTLAARAASVGMQAVAGGPKRPMLLRLGSTTQRAQAMQALGVAHKRGPRMAGAEPSQAELERHDTVLAVQALRARADVASADLNYIRRPLRAPNDTHYSYQWHYPMINLPQAWDITTGTPAAGQVIVAVIDTGVLLSHPDLAGKLVAGYDFVSDATRARDSNGIDPIADDPGDLQTPGKSSFHGTHVAGTIGALSNNGAGVAGVSWGAMIMPVRVLGQGGGTDYDIMQGVLYAAGLTNDSNTLPAQRADVINLSLGGAGYSQAAQDAITAARNAGVIIIAAAGNDNTSQLFYPASYAGVVSVSAVDMNKARAPYSNYGTEVDVAAPGGNMGADLNNDGFADGVLSTKGDDSAGAIQSSYEFENGTSMASPHVAGVAALMKAVHPGLTPAQFDTLLASGAITDDLGAPGRDDTFGHGLINALKAVQEAQKLASPGAPTAPAMVASTSNIAFGITRTAQTVSVQSGGAATVTGVSASASQPWLTVAPPTGSATGLGAYTVTVNDAALAAQPGLYSAKITFSSTTAGVTPIQVAVTIEVGGSASSAGTVGVLYFLLADAATLQAVPGQTVMVTQPVNGNYAYTFTGVAPGRYYVFAGTDLNNDGFICDAGEACGANPTLDRLAEVVISNANLTNLNFPVGLPRQLGAASAGISRSVGKRIAR
jgi:serine protease